MIPFLRVRSLVWLVLITLSLNVVAAPLAPPRTQDERLAHRLLGNSDELRSFTTSALEAKQREGWLIETRPGRAFVMSDLSPTMSRDLYLTPPASSGAQIGLRMRTNFVSNGITRIFLSAYDRSFNQVLSRRTFNVSSQSSAEEVRVQFDQTIQAMASEIAGAARSTSLKASGWKLVFHWLLPSAHAATPASSPLVANTLYASMSIGVPLAILVLCFALGGVMRANGAEARTMVSVAILIFIITLLNAPTPAPYYH